MGELLRLAHVGKSFGESSGNVLSDVCLDVLSGDFLVVTGTSGQGKSTLLNIMGGLLSPDEGSVVLDGVDLFAASAREADALRRECVGFVFQDPFAIAALTARENLLFSVRKKGGGRCSDDLVDEALEEFGLSGCSSNLPSQMSRGQLRRLSIVRCLLSDAPLMLIDEPTNDLDSYWCEKILDAFSQLAKAESHAVVMVTHDVRCVERGSRRLLLDVDGRLKAQ